MGISVHGLLQTDLLSQSNQYWFAQKVEKCYASEEVLSVNGKSNLAYLCLTFMVLISFPSFFNLLFTPHLHLSPCRLLQKCS